MMNVWEQQQNRETIEIHDNHKNRGNLKQRFLMSLVTIYNSICSYKYLKFLYNLYSILITLDIKMTTKCDLLKWNTVCLFEINIVKSCLFLLQTKPSNSCWMLSRFAQMLRDKCFNKTRCSPCSGSKGPGVLHSQVQVHVGHSEQPYAQHLLRVPDPGLHRGGLRHLRPPPGDHHQRRNHKYEQPTNATAHNPNTAALLM